MGAIVTTSCRLLPLGLAAVALAGGGREAQADVFGLYAQGQAGAASPAGPGVGLRAGAQLLIFEAYVDRTEFFQGSSTTRAIGGLQAALPLGIVRLAARGGVGFVLDESGGLDGDTSHGTRSGFAARIGGAIEVPLSAIVSVGFTLEEEYFAVQDRDADTGTHTGTDALGLLYLKVGVGF